MGGGGGAEGGSGATGDAGDGDGAGGAGGSATHEALGRCAVLLFNLSLTMLSGAHDEAHLAWLPGALRCAEAAVAAAHPPRRAPPPLGGSAWRIPSSPPEWATPVLLHPMVSTREQPTCASFFSSHLQPGVPLLMHGHLEAEAWGGLAYFADLRALRQEHGARLVPVTLGSPLVGYGGKRHWPLRKLIDEHLLPSIATHAGGSDGNGAGSGSANANGDSGGGDSNGKGTGNGSNGKGTGKGTGNGSNRGGGASGNGKGNGSSGSGSGNEPDRETLCSVAYMAQHHLLHQCAPLQALLAVPPYTLGREMSPPNLWLGTRGTVTSLHSDPADNLLCQLSGFKYVRLYGLDQTERLSATVLRSKNANAFGTSPIRVEAPDAAEAYPAFVGAAYTEAILGPGDVLFIPRRWILTLTRTLTRTLALSPALLFPYNPTFCIYRAASGTTSARSPPRARSTSGSIEVKIAYSVSRDPIELSRRVWFISIALTSVVRAIDLRERDRAECGESAALPGSWMTPGQVSAEPE